MKNRFTQLLLPVAVAMAASALSASAQLPGAPENNGLTPKTATGWINGTNGINNFQTEALSVDIVNNGNVIVGWEDDGPGNINEFLGVWTLLDPNGKMITPQTVQTNRDVNGDLATLESTTNQYLSFFRSDNTPTPGWPGGWGPKVKANRFGNGMGMGSMSWAIGLEIPELFAINEDAGGVNAGGGVANLAASDDFPLVQLLNNDGTPLRLGPISGITNLGIVTLADADVQPAGSIRIGGWDYLSSGNILIVGESRQNADWVLTGQAAGRTPVYRIVTQGGIQVKGYTAVSATPDSGNIARNGAAVTANGFAIRWQGVGGATVRLFDNNGTPTTTNLDLATITGHPEAAGGGDGGGSGISGNGKDAYVVVGDFGGNTIWVTVLNANGTVRWSRNVANDLTLTGIDGTSAAIDESGQVVVVFGASPDPGLPHAIMGRRFDAAGNAVGGSFYVGELEIPDLGNPPFANSDSPKVAWRNGKIAIAWLSKNNPDFLGTRVIAQRLFVSSALPGAPENNGLTPKTVTSYINGTNGVNNTRTESIGVAIANNGNVLVGWEDDGDDINDIEAVWTMFDANGNGITPNTKMDALGAYGLGKSVTNKYLSFFRADGTATPGYVSWGPKIHANLFGSGIGHGANGDGDLMAGEVVALAGYAGGGGFPAVQLFDNSGQKQSEILAGASAAYATGDPGSIRIGDWEYLANGNVVIVGESRQQPDLVSIFGGASPQEHCIFRILTPSGTVVKSESLVSEFTTKANMWNGAGVTANGFGVRFADPSGAATVRLFDNSGNPTTGNLNLATLTGHPEAGGGGRGDGAGFHGNGSDAYVAMCTYAGGAWVTVLNSNGTVRWSRDVSDDLVLGSSGRGDVAIDESGQVVVVFDAKPAGYPNSVTMGRRFDATGSPVGGTFYVSEKEVPDLGTPPNQADTPRAYWRNGSVAIVWISRNDPNNLFVKEVAQRYFLTGPPSLSLSKSGGNVTISWPAGVTGYTLESTTNLAPVSIWAPVPGVVNNSVTVSNPAGNKFYRLKK